MTRSVVLFVDPDEGARAQIARALLEHAAPSLVARSAGTHPDGDLAGVAQVLGEVGMRFTPSRTATVDFLPDPPDLLIAVCEGGCPACPYVPGARAVERWPMADPGSSTDYGRLAALRDIRDELLPRIASLVRRIDR